MGHPGRRGLSGQWQQYQQRWAEVAYFLVPTGTTLNPAGATLPGGDGSTPLFALYRCQYVVLPRTDVANKASLPAAGRLHEYFQQPGRRRHAFL